MHALYDYRPARRTSPQRGGIQHMLDQLESSTLEVILVPQRRHTNEGGMIRVAANRNCAWYRKFCDSHPSSRGTRRGLPDTRIRRASILSILRRLAAGLPSRSKYASELLGIARRVA